MRLVASFSYRTLSVHLGMFELNLIYSNILTYLSRLVNSRTLVKIVTAITFIQRHDNLITIWVIVFWYKGKRGSPLFATSHFVHQKNRCWNGQWVKKLHSEKWQMLVLFGHCHLLCPFLKISGTFLTFPLCPVLKIRGRSGQKVPPPWNLCLVMNFSKVYFDV